MGTENNAASDPEQIADESKTIPIAIISVNIGFPFYLTVQGALSFGQFGGSL
jgi:hypothetical protein